MKPVLTAEGYRRVDEAYEGEPIRRWTGEVTLLRWLRAVRALALPKMSAAVNAAYARRAAGVGTA